MLVKATDNKRRESGNDGLHGNTSGEDENGEQSTEKCTSGQDVDNEVIAQTPAAGLFRRRTTGPSWFGCLRLHQYSNRRGYHQRQRRESTEGGRRLEGGEHVEEERKLIEGTSVQTFLGALAPISSPVATAPGMTERRAWSVVGK